MTDAHMKHDHSKMEHGDHLNAEREAHTDHARHSQASAPADQQAMHKTHADHDQHAQHGKPATNQHSQHTDHSNHEDIFRRRFWVSLILSIPVLLYTPMLQMWFGFTMPAFPFSQWVMPLFAVVIFVYGGVPFIQIAVPEIRSRQPGMMTLIFLAISVSFIYSLATMFVNLGEGFFWELVTLIDIMLLGHWIEMRSVRQASGYNVVALPLAAGVLATKGIILSPAVGALLMSLSTVIVAINAQLLRRVNLT